MAVRNSNEDINGYTNKLQEWHSYDPLEGSKGDAEEEIRRQRKKK